VTDHLQRATDHDGGGAIAAVRVAEQRFVEAVNDALRERGGIEVNDLRWVHRDDLAGASVDDEQERHATWARPDGRRPMLASAFADVVGTVANSLGDAEMPTVRAPHSHNLLAYVRRRREVNLVHQQ